MEAYEIKTLEENQNKIKDDHIFEMMIHSVKGTYVFNLLIINRDVQKIGKIFLWVVPLEMC